MSQPITALSVVIRNAVTRSVVVLSVAVPFIQTLVKVDKGPPLSPLFVDAVLIRHPFPNEDRKKFLSNFATASLLR